MQTASLAARVTKQFSPLGEVVSRVAAAPGGQCLLHKRSARGALSTVCRNARVPNQPRSFTCPDLTHVQRKRENACRATRYWIYLVQHAQAEGTSQLKHTTWSTGLSFSADGSGVVAQAGNVATRLLADRVGLTDALSTAMSRRGFSPTHDRGRVLT